MSNIVKIYIIFIIIQNKDIALKKIERQKMNKSGRHHK